MILHALECPPIVADPGSASTLVWALQVRARMRGATLPPAAILDGLTGGCFTLIAGGTDPAWWAQAGKMRHPRDLGQFLGWEFELAESDGTHEGYEEDLRPLVGMELTFGRPLLAYGGWPGQAAQSWGIITATIEEARPVGECPGAAEHPVAMTGWPVKVCGMHVEDRPKHSEAEAIRHALSHAQQLWADPLVRETAHWEPQNRWHSGAAAYAIIADAFRSMTPETAPILADLLATHAHDLRTCGDFCEYAATVLGATALRDVGEEYQALATGIPVVDATSVISRAVELADLMSRLAVEEEALTRRAAG